MLRVHSKNEVRTSYELRASAVRRCVQQVPRRQKKATFLNQLAACARVSRYLFAFFSLDAMLRANEGKTIGEERRWERRGDGRGETMGDERRAVAVSVAGSVAECGSECASARARHLLQYSQVTCTIQSNNVPRTNR